MIFISCSFDPYSMPYAEAIRSLFIDNGIDAYIAKHTAPESLLNYLKTKVQQSEAMVALITASDSPWQQTEITWAFEFNKPVYGIIQEGVEPRGILPYISVFQRFSPAEPGTLKAKVDKIIASISEIKEKQKKALIGVALVALLLWGISQAK